MSKNFFSVGARLFLITAGFTVILIFLTEYPAAAQNFCSDSTMVQLPLNWDIDNHVPADPNRLQGWITPKKQEGSLLCWAATTEMAVNFYGTILPQCQQVNDAFFSGRNGCCPNSRILTTSGCDNTDSSLPQFAQYGFHMAKGLITEWTELKTYICEKQSPFLYFYRPGGQEHVILVRGYDTSVNHVFIVDPLDPIVGPVTDAYDFDYMFRGGENHTRDYIDICPETTAVANGGSCPRLPQ